MNGDRYEDTYKMYKLREKVFGDGKYDDIRSRLIRTPADFDDFHRKAENKIDIQNGATVVFTGKQFIFAKTPNDGEKGHGNSFAETYLAMQGSYGDISFTDACRLTAVYDKKYLIMTFEDEKYDGKAYKEIRLWIPEDGISNAELASFQAFFDRFAPSIRKYGYSFFVRRVGKDEDIDINSIVNLFEYLKYICLVSDKKEAYIDPKGEQIVGCSNGYDESKTLV